MTYLNKLKFIICIPNCVAVDTVATGGGAMDTLPTGGGAVDTVATGGGAMHCTRCETGPWRPGPWTLNN